MENNKNVKETMIYFIRNALEHIVLLFGLALFILFPVIGLHFGNKIFINNIAENSPEDGKLLGFILTVFLNILSLYVVYLIAKSSKKFEDI